MNKFNSILITIPFLLISSNIFSQNTLYLPDSSGTGVGYTYSRSEEYRSHGLLIHRKFSNNYSIGLWYNNSNPSRRLKITEDVPDNISNIGMGLAYNHYGIKHKPPLHISVGSSLNYNFTYHSKIKEVHSISAEIFIFKQLYLNKNLIIVPNAFISYNWVITEVDQLIGDPHYWIYTEKIVLRNMLIYGFNINIGISADSIKNIKFYISPNWAFSKNGNSFGFSAGILF